MHRHLNQSKKHKIIKTKHNDYDINEKNKIHLSKIHQQKQNKIIKIDYKGYKEVGILMEKSRQYEIDKNIFTLSIGLTNHLCSHIRIPLQYGTCIVCDHLTDVGYRYCFNNRYDEVCVSCQDNIIRKQKIITSNMLRSFLYIKSILNTLNLQDLFPIIMRHYIISINKSIHEQLSQLAFYDSNRPRWSRIYLIPFQTEWLL